MEKFILNSLTWIFFLGGLFGMIMGFVKFFSSSSPSEYGVMGIGGGFWLLSAAIVIYIRRQTEALQNH